jgi:hypothetical protein
LSAAGQESGTPLALQRGARILRESGEPDAQARILARARRPHALRELAARQRLLSHRSQPRIRENEVAQHLARIGRIRRTLSGPAPRDLQYRVAAPFVAPASDSASTESAVTASSKSVEARLLPGFGGTGTRVAKDLIRWQIDRNAM